MESKQSKFAVQRKDKNGIIIASVCVAITVLFFGLMFWVYSLSLPSIYAGRISSANSMAKQTADSIICYIAENYDSLSADEYYFYGENGWCYTKKVDKKRKTRYNRIKGQEEKEMAGKKSPRYSEEF